MNTAVFKSILDPEYNKNPFKYFSYLRKQNHLVFDEGINAYIVSKNSHCLMILNNQDLFSSQHLENRVEPIMKGKVLAQMGDDEHKMKKSLISKSISKNIIEYYYKDYMTGIVDGFINDLNSNLIESPFDLIKVFGNDFAIKTTIKMLGLNENKSKEIRIHLSNILKYAIGFLEDEKVKEQAFLSSDIMESEILKLIKLKREKKDDHSYDLISFILNQSDEMLEDNEIVALSLNILAAATEPVDKTLGYSIYHLMKNPNQLALIQKDKSLIENLIAETLRFTPTIHLLPRKVMQDTLFYNTNLKKGDTVVVLIPSANRDEEVYINPETFDILREENKRFFTISGKSLSFGSGPHFCLGAQFSKIQLAIALEKIIPYLSKLEEYTENPIEFEGIYSRGPTKYLFQYSR